MNEEGNKDRSEAYIVIEQLHLRKNSIKGHSMTSRKLYFLIAFGENMFWVRKNRPTFQNKKEYINI